MKIFLNLIVLCLVFSCSSQKRRVSNKKAEIYYSNGTRELMNGKYSDALRFLSQAKKLSPKRSDITNNLAMAYFFKGKKNKALKLIKEAIKLDNKNTDARANLASIYLKAKKYKRARFHYKKVLEDLTYKKQFQTYYNLGILENKLGRSKKAQHFFKLSIKENEYSCGALYQLGLMSLKSSKNTDALNYFEKGTDGPCYKMEKSLYYLGMTHQILNNNQKAARAFNRFIKTFPKSSHLTDVKLRLSEIDTKSFENAIYSKDNDFKINQ